MIKKTIKASLLKIWRRVPGGKIGTINFFNFSLSFQHRRRMLCEKPDFHFVNKIKKNYQS